jgi:hypothetical protein
VDRRATSVVAPVVDAPVVVDPLADTTTSGGGGGIFAMFKSYNRKPSATNSTAATSSDSTASTATNKATATDTHFVYLGTMQDYKGMRDKSKRRSPTSTGSGSGSGSSVGGEEVPYVNVKYAEFKSRSKL